jgi:predicted anti-sigma-YlaC factor YlaD
MTEPFPPLEGLTEAILARTSGSPCRRLEALACDLVDGLLKPVQQSLAQAHLEHCPACRTLVAGLRELEAVLPAFTDLDPGPAFTAEVLEATLPAAQPSFRGTWIRLVRRPRLCLEAAYLGTVAGILTLHAPLPVWRAAPTTLARLAAPVERVTPLIQSGHTQARACEQKAAATVVRQVHKARSLWTGMMASVRAWLARFQAKFQRTF